MHQCVWREIVRRYGAAVPFALASAHQMGLAAHQGGSLCVAQGVAHSVYLVQSHPEALTDLLEQSGQGFSALAVILRHVWTKENGIYPTTCGGEQFIHLVVHEVEAGQVKQTTT